MTAQIWSGESKAWLALDCVGLLCERWAGEPNVTRRSCTRGRRSGSAHVRLRDRCSARADGSRRVVSAQTNIVTVKQRCTTTIKTEDICAKPKPCYLIETCAEAYYRYTVCKDLSLDGGSGYPRNGIPCQKLCSEKAQALEMANKIIERPFSPQARSETACSPG
jgi:hypothetical protein